MPMPKGVFIVGHAYYATGVLHGVPRRLAVVTGRTSDQVAVILIDGVANANIFPAESFGREFAQFDATDGQRYNMSAAAEVPLEESAEVLEMIRKSPI